MLLDFPNKPKVNSKLKVEQTATISQESLSMIHIVRTRRGKGFGFCKAVDIEYVQIQQ